MCQCNISFVVFVATSLYGYLQATTVDSCDENVLGQTLQVNVSSCEIPPCVLKKYTDVTVSIRFISKVIVLELTHSVKAKWWIFSKGFPGVDGYSAKKNVFEEDCATTAGWPLKPGQEYIYKNTFPIKFYYPPISLTVYWALKDSHDMSVTCFKVDAEITS